MARLQNNLGRHDCLLPPSPPINFSFFFLNCKIKKLKTATSSPLRHSISWRCLKRWLAVGARPVLSGRGEGGVRAAGDRPARKLCKNPDNWPGDMRRPVCGRGDIAAALRRNARTRTSNGTPNAAAGDQCQTDINILPRTPLDMGVRAGHLSELIKDRRGLNRASNI